MGSSDLHSVSSVERQEGSFVIIRRGAGTPDKDPRSGQAKRYMAPMALSLNPSPLPARAIRFSKIFYDFCSRGLNHLILYLKRSDRSKKSKE